MIIEGLRQLGLHERSLVLVHSSLRSFGTVDHGAVAVCQALLEVCGTVLLPAGTWDMTGIAPPPSLTRPHNASQAAPTWDAFDQALERAVPFAPDLPIDRELGRIPETMRQHVPHVRSTHPLLSYLAVGQHADALVGAQQLQWPLGPIEALIELGGDVLLLGVDHTANTTIHLAEQHLGRSRFYRHAKVATGVWAELPNIPGASHHFGAIEPVLVEQTHEVMIGDCRARRIQAADVYAAATRLIQADPAAILCDDVSCRCVAALQQRLTWLEKSRP